MQNWVGFERPSTSYLQRSKNMQVQESQLNLSLINDISNLGLADL